MKSTGKALCMVERDGSLSKTLVGLFVTPCQGSILDYAYTYVSD